MTQPLRGDLGQTQKMVRRPGQQAQEWGTCSGARSQLQQALLESARRSAVQLLLRIARLARISSGIKSMVSAPLTSAIGIVKLFWCDNWNAECRGIGQHRVKSFVGH
ncbi:hypothetical protein P7H22_26695 [Paenibacillus larvae]|nr:hypothetical protein [Paenibacillus larvae]MDT2243194.1 hypothetical protein [Paenibacillus larvae]